MNKDDVLAEIARLDDAIVKNTMIDIQQEGSGIHPLEWTPLLIAAAVFWTALG